MIREEPDLEVLAKLESQIPEFEKSYPVSRLESRLKDRESLVLVYYDEERPVAYKVGYAETDRRFYSWIGGVLPGYRRRGIARELLHYQEDWCFGKGFSEITVWSENRYRSMVLFLIQEGYDIAAVSVDGKILFRKQSPPRP